MLKNIDSLNNTVRAVFIKYGIDCEINFLYSQYPDRSDLQCNELLKPVSYTHLTLPTILLV